MLLAIGLSVLIGVSLGLLGGGGSILTVPILVYALGVEPKSAIATSLLVVGTTSAAAVIPHARGGRVRWRTALIFGAAGMGGAYAGGRVAHFVPGAILLVAFALMMFATAIAMMRGRKEPAQAAGREEAAAPLTASAPPRLAPREMPILKVVLEGAAVGAVTGLVGAGGGFLVVPALVLLGGLPMGVAVGTSLVVIAMKSLAGFVGYLGHAFIDWRLAGVVTAAAVAGSVLGGVLAGRVPQAALRKAFAWFVIVMAIYILGRQIPAAVLSAYWPWLLAGGALLGALGLALRLRARLRGSSRAKEPRAATRTSASAAPGPRVPSGGDHALVQHGGSARQAGLRP
jgi:uncharacterized membrane protein YfcA